MARKAAQADTKANAQAGEESVQGYFKRIFQENPKWLKGRSNAAVLQRWLDDHPGHKEVPGPVKASLQNTKGIMRSRRRKRKARKAAEGQAAGDAALQKPSAITSRGRHQLEGLEERIDDCLTMAKSLDREGLAEVITLLRRARNKVVWKEGQ
jgi:hypothetical protein